MTDDLPKHPEKLLPKYDPDKKEPPEDPIKKFMLTIRLMAVQHEDVVCSIVPLYFRRKGLDVVFQPSTKVNDKLEPI